MTPAQERHGAAAEETPPAAPVATAPRPAAAPAVADAAAVAVQQQQVPSHPLTLDDLLPLLTSNQRSSSNSSDALADLYQQYFRQGSASFSGPHQQPGSSLLRRQGSLGSALLLRQDSTFSGGLERRLSGLATLDRAGSSLDRAALGSGTFLLTPRGLTGLAAPYSRPTTPNHSTAPGAPFQQGLPALGTSSQALQLLARAGSGKGLWRQESLCSAGQASRAELSPSLASLLGVAADGDQDGGAGRTPRGLEWMNWPPLAAQQQQQQGHLHDAEAVGGSAAGHAAASSLEKQPGLLQPEPSVAGWLPASSLVGGFNTSEQQQGPTELADIFLLGAPGGGSGSSTWLGAAGPGANHAAAGAAARGLPMPLLPQDLGMHLTDAPNSLQLMQAAAAGGGTAALDWLSLPGLPLKSDDRPAGSMAGAGSAAGQLLPPRVDQQRLAARQAARAARWHRKQVLLRLRANKPPRPARRARPRRQAAASAARPRGTASNSRRRNTAAPATAIHRLQAPPAVHQGPAAALSSELLQHMQQQQQLMALPSLAGLSDGSTDGSDDELSSLCSEDFGRIMTAAAAAAAAAGAGAEALAPGHHHRPTQGGPSMQQPLPRFDSDLSQMGSSAAAAAAGWAPAAAGAGSSSGLPISALWHQNSVNQPAGRAGGSAGGGSSSLAAFAHAVPGGGIARHASVNSSSNMLWQPSGSAGSRQHRQVQLQHMGSRNLLRSSSSSMDAGQGPGSGLIRSQSVSGAVAGAGLPTRSSSGFAAPWPQPPPPPPPPPPQQQQQPSFLAMNSWNRVIVDPHTSALRVVPRTKKGRWLQQQQLLVPPASQLLQQEQQQQVAPGPYRVPQQPIAQGGALPARPGGGGAANAAAPPPSHLQGRTDAAGPRQLSAAPGSTSQQPPQQSTARSPAMPPEPRSSDQQQQQRSVSSSIAQGRARRAVKQTPVAVAAAAAAAAAAAGISDGDDDSDERPAGSKAAAAARRRAAGAGDDSSSDFASGCSDPDASSCSGAESSDDEEDELLDDSGAGSSKKRRKRAVSGGARAKRQRAGGNGNGSSQTANNRGRQAPAAAGGGQQQQAAGAADGAAGPADAAGRPVFEETRSRYRGVTRHKRSGRWEAHIWVKELGRQVYLGGYELEEAAAEAYDMVALRSKGTQAATNFPAARYPDLLGGPLNSISLEELIMSIRRQSQGFSRGSSNFRGVTAHPSGRWEARIGIPGSRHVYLGLFGQEDDAARAYDTALVRLKGAQAATNYRLSDYKHHLAQHHQMKMACEAGLVSRDLFKNHSGADFELWIKQGLAAFDMEVSDEAAAKAQAETDSGNGAAAATEPAAGGAVAAAAAAADGAG